MKFKEQIAHLLQEITQSDYAEIFQNIEIPPSSDLGDYAYPCFRHAKTMRKAPLAIAAEIAAKLPSCDFIEEVKPTGGYINFYVRKEAIAASILSAIWAQKEQFGASEEGKGKNICIDFSSPNIAKPFHVGHLRSTAIGRALYNLYSTLGYTCYGINHLGDWGTQFGKLIVAYQKWGNKDDVENYGIEALNKLYVRFHDEAEKDDRLNDEARLWFVKMEQGDEEALSIWQWFYDLSIREFEKVYELLDVHFDAYTGESFYNDKMAPIFQELKEKGLLEESKGAQIVDLSAYDMPPCLVVRADGGTLYATRDITTALYRKKTYSFSKSLYVTALDQGLHFAQFFKVLELMGYPWAADMVHVPFGLVSLESGKLSTRRGNVVLMEDLLKEAVEKTKAIIEDKNPLLPNKDQVAKDVGIGAVIFNDLSNNRIKDVVFSWERILNFDGETGPYVQYAYARACSILNKAACDLTPDVQYNYLTDEFSIDLCKKLDLYPEKIKEAADKYEPSILTRHLIDIAHSFNKFYNNNPILTADEQLRNARLLLVSASRTVLKSGLLILGIQAPEQM